ncbi:MAG: hypothetical protein LBJ42_00545, partial [Holosporales bacterium]|nr:hypothetical protein [Holosporales bacterium]
SAPKVAAAPAAAAKTTVAKKPIVTATKSVAATSAKPAAVTVEKLSPYLEEIAEVAKIAFVKVKKNKTGPGVKIDINSIFGGERVQIQEKIATWWEDLKTKTPPPPATQQTAQADELRDIYSRMDIIVRRMLELAMER